MVKPLTKETANAQSGKSAAGQLLARPHGDGEQSELNRGLKKWCPGEDSLAHPIT